LPHSSQAKLSLNHSRNAQLNTIASTEDSVNSAESDRPNSLGWEADIPEVSHVVKTGLFHPTWGIFSEEFQARTKFLFQPWNSDPPWILIPSSQNVFSIAHSWSRERSHHFLHLNQCGMMCKFESKSTSKMISTVISMSGKELV